MAKLPQVIEQQEPMEKDYERFKEAALKNPTVMAIFKYLATKQKHYVKASIAGLRDDLRIRIPAGVTYAEVVAFCRLMEQGNVGKVITDKGGKPVNLQLNTPLKGVAARVLERIGESDKADRSPAQDPTVRWILTNSAMTPESKVSSLLDYLGLDT